MNESIKNLFIGIILVISVVFIVYKLEKYVSKHESNLQKEYRKLDQSRFVNKVINKYSDSHLFNDTYYLKLSNNEIIRVYDIHTYADISIGDTVCWNLSRGFISYHKEKK